MSKVTPKQDSPPRPQSEQSHYDFDVAPPDKKVEHHPRLNGYYDSDFEAEGSDEEPRDFSSDEESHDSNDNSYPTSKNSSLIVVPEIDIVFDNYLPEVGFEFELIEENFKFFKKQLEGGYRQRADSFWLLFRSETAAKHANQYGDGDDTEPSLLNLLGIVAEEPFANQKDFKTKIVKIITNFSSNNLEINRNEREKNFSNVKLDFNYGVISLTKVKNPSKKKILLAYNYFRQLLNAYVITSKHMTAFYQRRENFFGTNKDTLRILFSAGEFLSYVGLLLANAATFIPDFMKHYDIGAPSHMSVHLMHLAGFLMLLSLVRCLIDFGTILKYTFQPTDEMKNALNSRWKRFCYGLENITLTL